MGVLKNVIFISFLLCAVWQDITTRKIRNQYNIIMLLTGILCAAVDSHMKVGMAVLGALSGLGSGLLLWGLGMFRAGDAKLLCGVGAFGGPAGLLNYLILSILAGGVCSVMILLKKRDLIRRLKRIGIYIKNLFLSRNYKRYEAEDQTEFPFSVALALGGLLGMVIHVI